MPSLARERRSDKDFVDPRLVHRGREGLGELLVALDDDFAGLGMDQVRS